MAFSVEIVNGAQRGHPRLDGLSSATFELKGENKSDDLQGRYYGNSYVKVALESRQHG